MDEFVSVGDILVARPFRDLLAASGLRSCSDFLDYPGGERICHKRGRSVYRLEVGGKTFYLKRNRMHPVEFWKCLLRLRLPPRSAWKEWEGIRAIREAGVPTVTPVAFGERLLLGRELASFTLTEELYGAEPFDEYIAREWSAASKGDKRREKRRLLQKLALLARRFHDRGMNHQDFYLNHFFLDREETFYLLDLQRVEHREKTPRRYLVKDLGQLAYSSLRFPSLSRTDKMFFFLHYRGTKKLSVADRRLVREIMAKTTRIARHDARLRVRRIRRGELQP
jgi:heptose I phosphotransferase